MKIASRIVCLPVVLVLSVTVAACSDESDPQPAAQSGGASSGTSNAQDAARVKLLQCVREQGVDVPDDAQGTDDAFAQLGPAERRKMEAALQGPCRDYAARAFGDASEVQSEEFLDALTAFTACLRKNGADVPDPDPNAPFEVLHSLDQSDPTIAAAIAECQDKLPSRGLGG